MDVQKKKLDSILKTLDQRYGTEKEGFLHEEEWQLLAAIMLSAQSTDKQLSLIHILRAHPFPQPEPKVRLRMSMASKQR